MIKNFNDMIVYEIYPRSFFDSNGDGIGDLKGIQEKVQHLVDLGINAVWITPCYKSPNVDNGYDVADYTEIMDEFGTYTDWEALRDELHKNGISIIMDLVLNHTSDQHKWFQESRKSKDNPYRNYYYWAKTPNLSFNSYLGEANVWEYDPVTEEYYLHTFAKEQPDLNWTNPEVRKGIRDIVDFWIERGVDGFRCDAIGFIAKDFENNTFINGEIIHEYINELFDRPIMNGVFTVGECDIHTEEAVAAICGKERGELSAIFQFDHLEIFHKDKKEWLPALKNVLIEYQRQWQKYDLYGTVFLENHDRPRSLNSFGDIERYHYESATMLAAMFMMLKGIPFLHQGQEIGVCDLHFDDIAYFNDPISTNFYKLNVDKIGHEKAMEHINRVSRDHARRPMPWTGEKNVGFTTGEPWLPINEAYRTVNVEKDRASEKSIFAFYQKLIALRKGSNAIKNGSFTPIDMGENCFAYERSDGNERYLIICNFDKENKLLLPEGSTQVLGNVQNTSSIFQPFETRIYKF